MMSEERAAWLASLAPGDEVAIDVRAGYESRSRYRICKVTKVNRANGRTIFIGEGRFDEHGLERGVGYRRMQLEPVTPAVRESMERLRLSEAIRSALDSRKGEPLDRLPLETVRQLHALLTGATP